MSAPLTPQEREWCVLRFEHPSGRYVELASNYFGPEEIQLPPDCKDYRFAKSTPMVPAADLEQARAELTQARDALQFIKDIALKALEVES